MKFSIELWEHQHKIFLVEMYKIAINNLESDMYQNGTYSNFVKFIYSHYHNHNVYNIFE